MSADGRASYRILYTKHLTKKAKTWSDGFLDVRDRQAMLYDEGGKQLGATRLPGTAPLDCDETLKFFEGLLVTIDSPMSLQELAAALGNNATSAMANSAHSQRTMDQPSSAPVLAPKMGLLGRPGGALGRGNAATAGLMPPRNPVLRRSIQTMPRSHGPGAENPAMDHSSAQGAVPVAATAAASVALLLAHAVPGAMARAEPCARAVTPAAGSNPGVMRSGELNSYPVLLLSSQ